MSPTKARYNGNMDVPKCIAAFTRFTNGTDGHNGTLDEIRRDYDAVCDRFGAEFRLPMKFVFRIDYFPVNAFDLWEPGASMYMGGNELGRVREVRYDDRSAVFVLNDIDITFRIAHVGSKVEEYLARFRREDMLAVEAEEEEAAIRRIAERFRV